jgi:PEP-CTERM motif
MKKTFLIILTFALLFIASSSLSAGTYFFNPTPSDLYDLVHQKYYTWGIEWDHTTETITEAVLTFTGIYDWRQEVDSLYMHLLDDPAIGVTIGSDNEGGGDYFAGMGPWITTWSDPNGGSANKTNLSYSFSSLGLVDDLNAFAADGDFGIGLDADCHYYNEGIGLEITTSPIPEPATLSLLGIGFAMIGMRYRRKK